MKSITIKIIGIDADKITGIEVGGENENKITEINMNRSIYLTLLVEMRKANIAIDSDLKCFENRIFTIFEREWKEPPVFGAALRRDIEQLHENSK